MPSLKAGIRKSPKIFKALLPRPRGGQDDRHIDDDDVNTKVIETVCDRLKAGEIGILPTETVYGLVGSALCDAVVQRIYDIKGRDRGNPLPVQVSSWEDVRALGVQADAQAEFLAHNFWPGPMTLVLPFLGAGQCRQPIAGELLKQWTEKKTVAVRIPDHPVMRMVLGKTQMPLVATSANASGQGPLTDPDRLDSGLRDKVDWVVDAGPTQFGRESTVVLCDREGWRILREGAIRGIVIQKAFAQG